MRELLMNICPSAIWAIVVLEAVIAVLLFMHWRRERQTVAPQLCRSRAQSRWASRSRDPCRMACGSQRVPEHSGLGYLLAW